MKPPHPPAAGARDEQTVLRFDIHQRLQHAGLASSFVVLALTGWPLATHGLGPSRSLAALFGGVEGCALAHRIAAVVLILAAVYHAIYLAAHAARRRLPLSMVPTPGDVRDLVGNVLFFLGLREDRPRFPRYTYFEKFDYWAVFWGVFVMVGSGLIRWFPEATTEVLPGWAYEIAYWAHADEALLAALAIFLWHFYNVHLRPSVFPMSRVFLHGRLTLHQLEEEHGAEYDALVKAPRQGGAPTPRTEDRA